jgi:hypothetical protein
MTVVQECACVYCHRPGKLHLIKFDLKLHFATFSKQSKEIKLEPKTRRARPPVVFSAIQQSTAPPPKEVQESRRLLAERI